MKKGTLFSILLLGVTFLRTDLGASRSHKTTLTPEESVEHIWNRAPLPNTFLPNDNDRLRKADCYAIKYMEILRDKNITKDLPKKVFRYINYLTWGLIHYLKKWGNEDEKFHLYQIKLGTILSDFKTHFLKSAHLLDPRKKNMYNLCMGRGYMVLSEVEKNKNLVKGYQASAWNHFVNVQGSVSKKRNFWMATLINQGHNATNKTQVENLELASQLLNFPESGTSSSSSRSRSSPLSTTQAKGSMPAAEFMKSGKSQQNLFTLQNQILDKLTSLRSEKSLEKEPQALDYSSTLEAPPSLPVEPESHSNAPPLNDSEEGTLTTSFMGKGEVLSDEESFLPLEITICLEESFSRDKSSSDDGSGSNYSPLNEKTEIPDLVQEPTPPVEITIDKFPKAHRNNSTRDEQYWMPQRENLRTMIKAFKEGRIVCINGENHSVQEYGNETKIYEKVAQIYKIRRKNLYKVLDRIGIRKISKVTQWTPEIIEELRRKADEGLGYRDLENYFKSDRRDIQAICLQNNIHVHPKVRSKTLTLRNFTEKQIEEIKEFSKRGFTHLQIAKKMKTTKAIIYSILKRGGKTARVYWTTEQVQELIRLKETTNLPWKAIAEYFPGKSAQSVKDKYRSEKAKRRKKRKVPPSNSVYEALEKKNSKRGKPN